MSLRTFYDNTQNQFVFPSLDALQFEINNVPITGITGSTSGNFTSLSCNDNSITIGSTAGGYTLSNAGQNVGKSNLNMHNNAITNVNQLNVGNYNMTTNNSGILQIQNGSLPSGEIYDSYYNPPVMSDLIGQNNTINFNNAYLTNILSAEINDLSVSQTINSIPIATILNGGSNNTLAQVIANQAENTTITYPAGITMQSIDSIACGTMTIGNLYGESNNIDVNADLTFSNGNMTGINSVSCSSLTVNGTNITGGSGGNAINKSVIIYNQVFPDGNASIPIGGNASATLLQSFTLNSGCNYIKCFFDVIVQPLDITGSGAVPPYYKSYSFYIGYSNSNVETNLTIIPANTIVTYQSAFDTYSLKGTCVTYINSGTYSNLGLYVFDNFSSFPQGSLVNSVTTSFGTGSYASLIVEMEQISNINIH